MNTQEPNLTCPFTGEPISIVHAGEGWFGAVAGKTVGYITTIFRTKDELLYFLSTRNAVKPEFPVHPKIEVRDAALPPTADPQSLADMSEAKQDEIVQEHAEKILADRRVRRAIVGK